MNESKTKRRRKPKKCPKCGSREVLEIFRGLPPAPRPGERFHYAGCNIPVDGPKWHCEACAAAEYLRRLDLWRRGATCRTFGLAEC